jgi:hypothetical protein
VHPHSWKSRSSLVDVLSGNCIPARSVLFRRAFLDPLPAWFGTVRFGDWALWILLAQHGKIGHVDEVMGVYRRHSSGVWFSLSRASKQEGIVAFCTQMNRNLDFRYDRELRRTASVWLRV